MGHAEAGEGWSDLLAGGRLPRFALICLGVWLNAADSLVTTTIMPSVGTELGGFAYFSWAVSGFLVGAIMAGASAGRLSEVLGLRFATTLAGVVVAVGCGVSAAAPDIGVFLVGRLVQGLGCGWISGFAMVAVAMLFPERHLARVFASVAGVWGIATVLGPLVGGVFAQTGNWRAVFWLFAAQALVFGAAAPVLLARTAPPGRGPGIPWLQLVVLAVGVGAISLADVGGSSLAAPVLIAAGLGILMLVLRIDGRSRVRLLPRRIADLGTVCGAGYAAIFALTASAMGLGVYGPAILQTLQDLSPLWAGYVVGTEALAWTLAAFVVSGAGPAAEPLWIRFGGLCVLAGVAALAVVMRDGGLGWIVAAAALQGAGFGFSFSLMNRQVLGVLPDEDRAVGASAFIAVQQTGGAVGAAIAGATANLVGFGAGLTVAATQAAAVWVFVAALPLAVAGAWAAWRLTSAAAKA